MRSGKGGINGLAEKIGLKSQWSLTFEVRKRLAVAAHLLGRVFESQWSLTFEVRKSPANRNGHARRALVAMEPDL